MLLATETAGLKKQRKEIVRQFYLPTYIVKHSIILSYKISLQQLLHKFPFFYHSSNTLLIYVNKFCFALLFTYSAHLGFSSIIRSLHKEEKQVLLIMYRHNISMLYVGRSTEYM